MLHGLAGLWIMTACAPPPEVGPGAAPELPSIELIYPPSTATELPLDSDGVFRTLVVVHIDGFEYLSPVMSDMPADVEGQGHWHLNVNNVYVNAPGAAFYSYESDTIGEGDSVRLQVVLATNNHEEIPDYQDVVEFNVVAPVVE